MKSTLPITRWCATVKTLSKRKLTLQLTLCIFVLALNASSNQGFSVYYSCQNSVKGYQFFFKRTERRVLSQTCVKLTALCLQHSFLTLHPAHFVSEKITIKKWEIQIWEGNANRALPSILLGMKRNEWQIQCEEHTHWWEFKILRRQSGNKHLPKFENEA